MTNSLIWRVSEFLDNCDPSQRPDLIIEFPVHKTIEGGMMTRCGYCGETDHTTENCPNKN